MMTFLRALLIAALTIVPVAAWAGAGTMTTKDAGGVTRTFVVVTDGSGNFLASSVVCDATAGATCAAVDSLGRLSTVRGGVLNAGNSSTTPLAGAGTFTGTGIDVSAYSSITIVAFSNVSSANGGMQFQFSSDNTNWDDASTYTFAAGAAAPNAGQSWNVGVRGQFFRVVYINGASAQAAFRLQTILMQGTPTGDIVDIGVTLSNNTHALATYSVITGTDAAGGSAKLSLGNATGNSTAPLATQMMVSDGTLLQRVLAPIILGDTVNGNNMVSVGNWVWNGTTWDRAKSGDVNNVAAATGYTDAAAIGRYNATQPTLTDTRYNMLQLSSRGELLVAPGTTGFATTATLATETTKVIGTVRVQGNVGGVLDAIGQNVSAPANWLQVGCQFNTTPTTITTGNGSPCQMDANGNMLVSVRAATGLAQGSTTSGQTGSMIMGAVTTTAPAYTTAQTAYASLDLFGGLRINGPYPAGATPITASATGTTAATTATLATGATVTTYLCGFSIRANATAAVTNNATVTGTITGTLNFTQWTAPNASGLGVTEMIFNPCVPASAANTSIAVVSGAPGTGGVVSTTAWGFTR